MAVWSWISTHLVQLLDPKSCVLKKAGPKSAFGNHKKLRLGQKLRFKNAQRTRINYGPHPVHFAKAMGVLGYLLGVSVQIPNCLSANVFRDRTIHFTLGHISSLRKLLLPLISVLLQDHHSLPFKRKSLFSFVIRWKPSSSSSSFFVFFNEPSSVIFFFLFV